MKVKTTCKLSCRWAWNYRPKPHIIVAGCFFLSLIFVCQNSFMIYTRCDSWLMQIMKKEEVFTFEVLICRWVRLLWFCQDCRNCTHYTYVWSYICAAVVERHFTVWFIWSVKCCVCVSICIFQLNPLSLFEITEKNYRSWQYTKVKSINTRINGHH